MRIRRTTRISNPRSFLRVALEFNNRRMHGREYLNYFPVQIVNVAIDFDVVDLYINEEQL